MKGYENLVPCLFIEPWRIGCTVVIITYDNSEGVVKDFHIIILGYKCWGNLDSGLFVEPWTL